MKEYHKIQTVYLRDPDNNYKTLLEGQYALPEFEFLARCNWVFTEKVDGTNIRVMWDGAAVTFGGKTDRAQIPAKLAQHLQETFVHDAMAGKFGVKDASVCLYGEGHGAGIQRGGGNYATDQQFVLFDVLIDGCWLKREDVADIAEALEIPVVPVVGTGVLDVLVSRCRDGFESAWGPFAAEGIVARPSIELRTRSGHRIITKLKAKDFRG